jgi:hypothetical protein
MRDNDTRLERKCLDELVLHPQAPCVGMDNLNPDNPSGFRFREKPAYFPASNSEQRPNLILGFVFLVVELCCTHSQQLVIMS